MRLEGSIGDGSILLLLLLLLGLAPAADGLRERVMLSRSARRAATKQQRWTVVPIAPTVCRIPESVWRAAAQSHQTAVYEMLRPGLLDPKQILNSGIRRNRKEEQQEELIVEEDEESAASTTADNASWRRPVWTALDPKHPVYNFLIEYYGQKGVKSVRRLAQWSPAPHKNGVLLEGATELDLFNDLLFMRGALLRTDGIEYNPSIFFAAKNKETDEDVSRTLERAAAPFLWNRLVLKRTLQAEPVWHCYGLHEWAMQYQPDGAPPPPAAQYQSHLPLRVSQSMINQTVERKGVHCTHVDAWRFFAPAAWPLHHQAIALSNNNNTDTTALLFSRTHQLRLEQPACVHANMDLFRYALRLRPFVHAGLVQRALAVALHARTLDVAASPYDAATGYSVAPIPVETAEGRALYRQRQVALHREYAEPLRNDLLCAYTELLDVAFPGMRQQQPPPSCQSNVRHDKEELDVGT